jgi:hypothetical protein
MEMIQRKEELAQASTLHHIKHPLLKSLLQTQSDSDIIDRKYRPVEVTEELTQWLGGVK